MTQQNNIQNNTQPKQLSHLQIVHKNLTSLIDTKKDAMPKGFNRTRFIQNCMTVLQDTKGIDKVEPTSVARTLLKGAFLGLDFMNKECYAIPYGNQLQFITDYRGEKKLAKLYSVNPVKDIYAKLVRDNEEFEYYIEEGKQILRHKLNPFAKEGNIIGVYAVALYEDNSIQVETMKIDEIEHIRNTFSKMSQGQAWSKSWDRMALKTVFRRLCYQIELNFDNIEQKAAFDDGGAVEFDNKNKSTTKGQFATTEQVDELMGINAQKVMDICRDKQYNITKLTIEQYQQIKDELITVDYEYTYSENDNTSE